jgi:AAA+ lid domain
MTSATNRAEILDAALPDVDFDVVSRGTPGFSGADLANLVNEAAINAVRAGSMPWPSTKPGTRWWPRSLSAPIPSRRSRSFPAVPLAGATELATHMVREWGFSATVGPFS